MLRERKKLGRRKRGCERERDVKSERGLRHEPRRSDTGVVSKESKRKAGFQGERKEKEMGELRWRAMSGPLNKLSYSQNCPP